MKEEAIFSKAQIPINTSYKDYKAFKENSLIKKAK